jgi:hypothetical protein
MDKCFATLWTRSHAINHFKLLRRKCKQHAAGYAQATTVGHVNPFDNPRTLKTYRYDQVI